MRRKVKVYDFEQRTPEWYAVRELKFTASDANALISRGKGVLSLIEEKLMDYFSSGVFEEYEKKPYTKDMQRGVEFEEQARRIYELETGLKVSEVGFCELTENAGCSPDGLVGDDGLIEIKNHSNKVFFKLMQDRKIENKYLDQMQYQMFVTGRQWCDYFGFNPNFDPCFIKIRIHKDPEVFQQIRDGLSYAVPILLKRKEELSKLFKKGE